MLREDRWNKKSEGDDLLMTCNEVAEETNDGRGVREIEEKVGTTVEHGG